MAPAGHGVADLDGRAGAARAGRPLPARFRPRRRRRALLVARGSRRPRGAPDAQRRAARLADPAHQHGPPGGRADSRISRGCAKASCGGSAPPGRSARRAWAGRSASSGPRAAGSAASSARSASIAAACPPPIIAAPISPPAPARRWSRPRTAWSCWRRRRGFSLEGNLVIVDHGMGLSSAFLHLSSVAVRPGERVRQGHTIGRVGATGRATGPHLHWSLVWNGAGSIRRRCVATRHLQPVYGLARRRTLIPGWPLTRIMKLPSAPRLITMRWPGRGRSASWRLSTCDPDGAVLQARPSSGRPSCEAEATPPSTCRPDCILRRRCRRRRRSECAARQGRTAGAGPRGPGRGRRPRRSRRSAAACDCRRRAVETLQPRRRLGDRAAAHQRLKRLGTRRVGRRCRGCGRAPRRKRGEQGGEKAKACESCWGPSLCGRHRYCGPRGHCASRARPFRTL